MSATGLNVCMNYPHLFLIWKQWKGSKYELQQETDRPLKNEKHTTKMFSKLSWIWLNKVFCGFCFSYSRYYVMCCGNWIIRKNMFLEWEDWGSNSTMTAQKYCLSSFSWITFVDICFSWLYYDFCMGGASGTLFDMLWYIWWNHINFVFAITHILKS